MDNTERVSVEHGAAGCMLHEPRVQEVWRRSRGRVAWFHVEPVKLVVGCIEEMWRANSPVDLLTVVDELRRKGKLDDVGGSAFVEQIYEACPTSAHAEYYFDLLRLDSLRKGFRGVMSKLVQQVEEEAPELIVAQAGELLDRILHDHECQMEDKPGDIYDSNVRAWEKAKDDREAGRRPDIGVTLPWWRLTKLIGGLKPGLHILGARPSTGKTAMEGMIRIHAAMQGKGVLAQQVDMSREGLLMRDQCRIAGVSYKKLSFGFARHDQLQAVRDATQMLKGLPMNFIFANTSVELLCARARALKARGMLGLITVDCGQLLTYAGSGRAEVAERSERISGILKALALELEVPLLCLCQLRRPDPKQKHQPPDMEDIHGGRFWEANALTVALMYRNEKTWETWLKDAKEAFLAQTGGNGKFRDFYPKFKPICWYQAKNQNGETGESRFLLNGNYFRFVPADIDWKEEAEEAEAEGMTEE